MKVLLAPFNLLRSTAMQDAELTHTELVTAIRDAERGRAELKQVSEVGKQVKGSVPRSSPVDRSSYRVTGDSRFRGMRPAVRRRCPCESDSWPISSLLVHHR